MPDPRARSSPPGTVRAVDMMISVSWSAVSDGRAASRRAATPVTTAAAIEVPLRVSKRWPPSGPRALPATMSRPGAATATCMPRVLSGSAVPASSVAPTASTWR